MRITIKSYDSFLYRQLWEITDYRNGQIYNTRNTGKFVRHDWVNPDPTKWTVSSLSTSLTRNKEDIELDMFD